MSNPLEFLTVPANHLVTGLAGLVHVPTAAAIVLATVLVRLILVPVGYAQHRADQRRSALMGKVVALRERFGSNKKRLDAELTDLYRAEGGGLARGCLPMLVQMPVFAGLYQLFLSPTIAGKANLLLHQTMFGVPLGTHLFAASGPQFFVFGGLLFLLAAIGFASSRLVRPLGAEPIGAARVAMLVVPYLTVIAAVFVPLAASLYLVTSTAWTIAQTVALRHWAG